MLATLHETAPDGTDWVHEAKFDGYRIQARLENGTVKLLTRKGLDWTAKFRPVARLGYADYTLIDRKFRMSRPSAATATALNERKDETQIRRRQEKDI